MPDVPMPRLSDSMEEGTIVAWLVADGSVVAHGDEIVEVETDKATMACAAPHDGILRILVAAGETRDVGAAIAVIDGGAVNGARIDRDAVDHDGVDRARIDEAAAAGSALDRASDAVTSGDRPPAADEDIPARSPGRPARARPLATPVARRIAREHAVDLEVVRGSGPHGRVTKADVLAVVAGDDPRTSRPDGDRAAPSRDDAPAGTAEPSGPTSSSVPTRRTVSDVATGRDDVVRPPTRIEALIARRMEDSRRDVPEFTVTVDVAIDAVLDARATLRELAAAGDVVPTVNDFVVLACARVLREQPDVRRAWRDGSIVAFGAVDVGVAVAADDGGLVVPVVPDADRRTLGDLAVVTRDLTQRAREGRCTPAELSGGVFTVSNLGMLGVAQFTAIVPPGQGAILSVGASTERLAMVDGTVATRRYASLTLNCDHRVIYGAHAAAFLDRVRTLLEHPIALAT